MMRTAPLLLVAATLGASILPGQQTTLDVTLPINNPVPQTDTLPFAAEKIHYQQWYEGAQFRTAIMTDVRMVGMEFAGAMPAGVTLDIEITMANAGANLTGNFASNFQSNVVQVVPRRNLVITGAVTRFDFVNEFVYDGQSNVVVDIKIFGNGTGRALNYSAQSTVLTFSNVKRQYFIGDPNATIANSPGSTGHLGLETKFYYQEGGAYEYGLGCPGGRNIVPVGSSSAVPLPGDASYRQLLTQAGSGYPAVFVLGISDQTWNGITLPLPLDFLGGLRCGLNASPELMFFTNTTGGGPGAGTAQVATPIPAIGALAGQIVYTQWVVFDLAAPNGAMSATRGLRHVVGS